MDLVDIDQMLDNLELREAADENNRATKNECGTSNQLALSRGGSVGSHNRAGFVGVSQVFTSLDDYRKNVELLDAVPRQRYDEEFQLISETVSSENKSDHENESINAVDDGNMPRSPTPSVVNSVGGAVSYGEYGNDGEDEEEASNDLHKFTENVDGGHGHETNAIDDSTTDTSESLTTSSSSTFSSGPSPGMASTTDEPSAPLSPVNDTEERDGLLGTTNGAQCDVGTGEELEPVGANAIALEDLATGLSSISLTSANLQLNLPCEASVSSVLENVLEDLSETTSASLLSQKRENDALAHGQLNSKSSVNGTSEEKEPQYAVAPGSRTAIALEETAANEGEFVGNSDKFAENDDKCRKVRVPQQPITFGSTMDEISDTELDSMLQEMDIDDGVDVEANNESCNVIPAPTAETTALAVAESTSKECEESHPDTELNAMDELDSNVIAADCLNADSFSQASTVEFSEIRAQNVELMHGNDGQQSSNSVASSYTSSESSLDSERHSEKAECHDEDDDDVVEEGEEEEEEEDDSTGEDSEGHIRVRPQRPTTLNLPVLQPGLYSNAGQTPPGSNVSQDEMIRTENVENCSTTQIEQQANADGMMTENEGGMGVNEEIAEATGYSDPHANLGKIPPIWVPDNMAASCMQCQTKFTMIKRRHHCRACGKVLCSVCCSQKFKLEFLSNASESRVCLQCYLILTQRQQGSGIASAEANEMGDGDTATGGAAGGPARSPNPNNPMEYCSTIPPHRQVSTTANAQPPSVIVPVGVLKKDGSYSSNSSNGSSKKGRKRKSVMFSDGIAPGSDLACMEHQWGDAKHARRGHQQGDKSRSSNSGGQKPPTPAKSHPSSSSDATTIGLVASLFRGSIPPLAAAATVSAAQGNASVLSNDRDDSTVMHNKTPPPASAHNKTEVVASRSKRLPPSGCDKYGCFIPEGNDNHLPPIFVSKDESNCDFDYKEVTNNYELVERLQRETLKFALTKNFFVYVKIVNLKCCMNRTVINFTTCGMHCVGNDELIILLEYEPTLASSATSTSKEALLQPPIPKDIFVHLYEIYRDAELSNPIAELSYTSPRQSNFLGSREYGGFIFIRATYQCLLDVIVPENPFLIGILIHRYEVPWAKVFPLRLMLRLGAQYRYYPCPHISMPNRESVYGEIAQTIINILADFRNYSYTLPCIKGMYIHMEDRQTTVLIPRNRQEDVIKAIKNASDHILAFGGNFSKTADGHLVCMQNVNEAGTEMYSYSTQAINIQGQARKVTGASFFVLNESLKSTSGLSGKCSIVEDGLMVQILPAKMEEVRNALQNQKDIEIVCGPLDADEQQSEVVSIKWVENDRDFNIGVKSPIDGKSMEGISNMRVHDSFNYSNANYSIRLTDIYILKFDEWYGAAQAANVATSIDITRMAGQIARSASVALVPFLDLLAASGSRKLALRATLHQDNVCYEAGTRGNKLPPLYMNALDNHLIPTLHGESSGIEDAIVLELIFYILNV